MANTFRSARFAVHASSQYDDWETPMEFYETLNREFGFTLDVAASKTNAKCPVFFTQADDGLAQNWGGAVCWMNPPYGREIARWMEKALDASRCGATVVCLVPSRTDTRWWHAYAMQASECRFIKGRLRFARNGQPLGTKAASCPFPSAVVIFRPVTPP